MLTSDFEATLRVIDDVVVIDLIGDIDHAADEALTSAYTQAVSADPATVLLSFARVAYINSTGIALIVGLLARARKERRSLAVCHLSDHYRQIFEITRLSDFMTVFPDEPTAVRGTAAQ